MGNPPAPSSTSPSSRSTWACGWKPSTCRSSPRLDGREASSDPTEYTRKRLAWAKATALGRRPDPADKSKTRVKVSTRNWETVVKMTLITRDCWSATRASRSSALGEEAGGPQRDPRRLSGHAVDRHAPNGTSNGGHPQLQLRLERDPGGRTSSRPDDNEHASNGATDAASLPAD